MTTETTLRVRGINVQVARKPIKNLHLAVYPPDGQVRVAAPQSLDDEAVRLAVVDRLAWIRRQQQTLRKQPREMKRELVPGETHYLWGRRYRLRLDETAEQRPGARVAGRNTIVLTAPPRTDRDQRAEILSGWYRDQLKAATAQVVERWADSLNIEAPEWRIRKMRTKWGSCNPEARRIWLNLELAKKAPQCLDYVAVHEMVHLIEPKHSARFEQILDGTLPTWRTHRDELYRLPLGHEDWPNRA